MTKLTSLSLLLKNAKVPTNRKRRYSEKIIRRRIELVDTWNCPDCQMLSYSQIGKNLGVSSAAVIRDLRFLNEKSLLMPLRQNVIPYAPTETTDGYLKRFFAAHGVET
jgi:hypothetical protein